MAFLCTFSRVFSRSAIISRVQKPTTFCFFSTDNDVTLPQLPKRPVSGYIEFSNQKRSTLLQANPGIKLTDVAKMTGDLWRKLSDDEKQPYLSHAKLDLQNYQQQMQTCLMSLTSDQKELYSKQQNLAKEHREKLKKRRLRIKNRQLLRELRKPQMLDMSGYLCFCRQKNFMTDTGMKVTERMQQLARQWKTLSEQEKQVYNEEAETNRADYQTALVDWEQRMKDEGHPELVRGYKPNQPAKKSKRAKVKSKAKKAVKKTKKSAASKKTKKTKSSKEKTSDEKTKATKKRKPKEDENPSWMREE